MKTFQNEQDNLDKIDIKKAELDLKPVIKLIGNDFMGHLKSKT